MKKTIKKRAEVFIKKALDNVPNEVFDSLKSPIGKMTFSICLTGNIKEPQTLESFQFCTCKSEEEHKAKWENYKEAHAPQPLDFETIKNMYKVNEKYLTYFLNQVCIDPPKKLGRPRKVKDNKRGRPHRLYQPSEEKLQNFQKEKIADLCKELEITEKDLIKIIKKNEDVFIDQLL